MSAVDVGTNGNGNFRTTEQVEAVVIRFCGDSGDGMQLVGTQFTNVSAIFGNDVSTLPDFPAEIRAPAGTLGGVSGFQLCFSSNDIYTPGDEVDTLVAMNPAALKANLDDLKRGGTVILNEDEFTEANLKKAGYAEDPLGENDYLAGYRIHKVPMTRLTRDSVADLGLSLKEADRCKNFFALGLVFWLYDRNPKPTQDWIRSKFAKRPEIADANLAALKSGSDYGYSTQQFTVHYNVPPAKLPPGKYRKITGNEAVAMGLVTSARLADKDLFYSGYPITPASDILHELSKLKNYGVRTVQVEDEIAAITSTVGASYGGAFAVTASSGPGIALKSEGIGLGVIMELPMVIINVQRGGPSTGLPTKTEQADLLMSIFGRNGECPMPIVAAATPGDAFYSAMEAMRLAVEFMTPVFLLSDGYIANGAEPWMVPKTEDLPRISYEHAVTPNGDDGEFLPYRRDNRLVRPWAVPGTPGLEHRVGGLEKWDDSGNVSYDPENHAHMISTRARKVAGIADHIPEQPVEGPDEGDLLVVSWGGTYGSIRTAVLQAQRAGKSVAHAHIRYLSPFPRNLGDVLKRYKKVIVPELNCGQLRLLLRAEYLVDAQGVNKVKGKPFLVSEIREAIEQALGK